MTFRDLTWEDQQVLIEIDPNAVLTNISCLEQVLLRALAQKKESSVRKTQNGCWPQWHSEQFQLNNKKTSFYFYNLITVMDYN